MRRSQEFRTSPRLRIAVTVDMIATGTEIKPLERLLFLRDTRRHLHLEDLRRAPIPLRSLAEQTRIVAAALEDSANLSAPGIIAADIVADLEAALEQFAANEDDLKP